MSHLLCAVCNQGDLPDQPVHIYPSGNMHQECKTPTLGLQTSRSGYVYRRVGVMTYDVTLRGTDTHLGTVWRTRDGWSARNPAGRLVIIDYPGSRGVVAGLLAQAQADR